jgi:hypothetical protein
VTPSKVTTISAAPGATAEIMPAFTVTLVASDEDHCALAVTSVVLPSVFETRAAQCDCWPMVFIEVASQVTFSALTTGVGRAGLQPVR